MYLLCQKVFHDWRQKSHDFFLSLANSKRSNSMFASPKYRRRLRGSLKVFGKKKSWPWQMTIGGCSIDCIEPRKVLYKTDLIMPCLKCKWDWHSWVLEKYLNCLNNRVLMNLEYKKRKKMSSFLHLRSIRMVVNKIRDQNLQFHANRTSLRRKFRSAVPRMTCVRLAFLDVLMAHFALVGFNILIHFRF